MTVNEAIQQANAGDVVTMLDLGNHYSRKGDYFEAIKWYQKASDDGNLFGTLRTAYCNEYIIRIFMGRGEWDIALGIFRETFPLLSTLNANPNFLDKEYLPALRTESDNGQTYRDEYVKLLTALLTDSLECNYMLSLYDKIIDDTAEADDPHSLVIRAMALHNLYPDDAPVEKRFDVACKAYDILKNIISNGYTVRPVHLDQLLCAQAVVFYANALASGWAEGKKDAEKAYHILTSWRDRFTDDDAKETVSIMLRGIVVKHGIFGTTYSLKSDNH